MDQTSSAVWTPSASRFVLGADSGRGLLGTMTSEPSLGIVRDQERNEEAGGD